MSTQLATIKQTLTSEAMREQFARALPAHLSPERFCRIAITALTRTPKLQDCTKESLMRCLLDLSAFGLEPDGRRAHLIPYKDQCTLVIDWKGLAELALRSGLIAKLHADIVCENDAFEYSMGEVTQHKIDWKQPRGEMYAAYAMAQTKTGEKFFAVMSKDEIEAIRKRSRAGTSGPWVTDYNEMAKKTAFRRLAKWLPLSAEFRDAIDKDDEELPQRDVTPTVKPASQSKLFAPKETQPALVEVPAESLAQQVRSKCETAGITWATVNRIAMDNGFADDIYQTPEEATDADLSAILGAWAQIEAAAKEGGEA